MPNRMRRWYSGHLLVCSCDVAVSFLDIENSGQRRPLLYVWRIQRNSLGPRLKHPSLRRRTLVWPRRDVPRRLTKIFFQPSFRAQHDDLLCCYCCCCCCCVYSRMLRSHERRALGALLFLVSRCEPASTDSY